MSKTTVYHVKDLEAPSGRSLLGEIGDGILPINFPANHEVVAQIETKAEGLDGLDKAYHLTQNICDSWVRAKCEFVKLMGDLKPDRRSTHIGDVLVMDGVPYVCAPIGWEKVTSPDQKVRS